MKKWAFILIAVLTTLSLYGCSELEEGSSEKKATLVSINYDEVKTVKNTYYSSDSGRYEYEDLDGIETKTNQMFAEYVIPQSKQKEVQEFLLNYRVGTLTDIDQAPEQGYFVTLGYDQREYHIAKDVDNYSKVKIDLINGIKIETIDYYSSVEYHGYDQLKKLVENQEKKVLELKKDFGMVDSEVAETEEQTEEVSQ